MLQTNSKAFLMLGGLWKILQQLSAVAAISPVPISLQISVFSGEVF